MRFRYFRLPHMRPTVRVQMNETTYTWALHNMTASVAIAPWYPDIDPLKSSCPTSEMSWQVRCNTTYGHLIHSVPCSPMDCNGKVNVVFKSNSKRLTTLLLTLLIDRSEGNNLRLSDVTLALLTYLMLLTSCLRMLCLHVSCMFRLISRAFYALSVPLLMSTLLPVASLHLTTWQSTLSG